VPLTAVGPDKTKQFGLPGFEQELLALVRFMCEHIAGESTTSRMSSMKGGKFGNNVSNLNKGNILKPTFDTLTLEGRKAFEAYHGNLE
jgi:hypothetical protein